MPGRFLNTGIIFGHATAARDKVLKTAEPRLGGGLDALTAIVFAVTALETFMNEFIDLLDYDAFRDKWDERRGTLIAVIDELEKSRAPLKSKFLLAKWILSGVGYDKGTAPYQEFALLVDVRDALIHSRIDGFAVEGHSDEWSSMKYPFIRALESRNLTALFEKNTAKSWIAFVCTGAVARWACETAHVMAQSILETLPDKSMHRVVFESFFSGKKMIFPDSAEQSQDAAEKS
jgi:hypothetical protein